ncbi:intracellular protein transport protein USO1-like [Nicotiana tomentosiformis]|uniref:intracellular protein transport protein USO1-like n=1 Tax=Nicotiana tomentosiformis TaxID=4098 RepID=UPI00388C9B85
MAKTSKTVPQKEVASSSQPAGGKTLVEPRLEECIPGECALNSDFKIDKASLIPGLGKDAVMRPLSSEEEISILTPKLAKDKKRKKTSTSKDPKPKKKKARKSKKNIIHLTKDYVRHPRKEDKKEKEDDSGLVARVGMCTEAPKATESVKAIETPSRDEGVSGRDLGEVPESPRIEDASHDKEPTVGTAIRAGLEAPRDGDNAPSDPLGAIEIGGSPLLPLFSEEMIQEARALKTPSIEGDHGREDPFHDYFTRVEDATGLSNLEVSRKDSGEASSLFNEAQQAMNRASALHREVFSRSRAELSRYEADIQRLTEERNSLNLLSGQKEENIKDLRTELATAHKDQTNRIEQEVDVMKAETLGWKESMDRLAAKKEVARAQLSSVESQLRGMKEKSLAQGKKIEEIEARLASELAKAKSEAEKAKAELEVIVAVYWADAEAAQVQARKGNPRGDPRSRFRSYRRDIKAKEHEADAGAVASSNDDDDGSKSGSENGEDLDGEEAAPEEN